jgi:Flp pilus assembly CpaE family ATPase
VSIPILTVAEGAPWEADLIAELDRAAHGIQVVRRCLDVVDLLAVAATGQAVAALVDAQLRRLDSDAVDRLRAAGIAVVGVTTPGVIQDEERLRTVGVGYFVPADAGAAVVAAVVESAVADTAAGKTTNRAYADPAFATGQLTAASPEGPNTAAGSVGPARRGSIVAVWGPTGAPGRTTVAVTLADELARLDVTSLLMDADVYGGVIASCLGLLDESPGLAAACRQAQSRRLDSTGLAALAWQINPNFRVLTGITRAARWPELRTSAIESVLSVSRTLADFTVVDVGFALESDEELTFDTLAPRRNGATLTVLDHADLVLAVGSADPIGIQRLVRGLTELREAEVTAPVWIVLNRVRKGAVPGDPAVELDAALQRFSGQSSAALLPYDLAGLDGAMALGKTLGEVSPNSGLRRAVIELASAVAGVPVPSRGRRTKGRRRSGGRAPQER